MAIDVQRLGHVVLNVRSLAPAVDFYTRVLGLHEVGRLPPAMVFFSAGRGNHHDLALREVGMSAHRPGPDDVGLCHLALKIGDGLPALREAKRRLDELGVPIRRIESHRVSHSIYIADPDGNEVELYADDDPRIWRDEPSAVASVEPLVL